MMVLQELDLVNDKRLLILAEIIDDDGVLDNLRKVSGESSVAEAIVSPEELEKSEKEMKESFESAWRKGEKGDRLENNRCLSGGSRTPIMASKLVVAMRREARNEGGKVGGSHGVDQSIKRCMNISRFRSSWKRCVRLEGSWEKKTAVEDVEATP
ncbi:hypothetical protein L1887_24210 [Cichorium endivia]|nr:hypothetical protein L1887_24210 [Cichorium endivia]